MKRTILLASILLLCAFTCHAGGKGASMKGGGFGGGGGIPTAGLVGDWKCDEGEGTTLTDDSGQGNNGTITNETWVGNDLYFDDTCSVSMGDPAVLDIGTTDWSISVWVDVDSGDQEAYFVNKLSAVDGYSVGLSSAGNGSFEWILEFDNKGQHYDDTILPDPTGTWEHVVLLVDRSGNASLYIDAEASDSSSDISADDSLDGSNAEDFVVGYGYEGYIRKILIYNRLLSPAEITQIYNAG